MYSILITLNTWQKVYPAILRPVASFKFCDMWSKDPNFKQIIAIGLQHNSIKAKELLSKEENSYTMCYFAKN